MKRGAYVTRKNIIFTITVVFSVLAIILSATIVRNHIREANYIKTLNTTVDLMYDGFTESKKISDDAFENWQLAIEDQPSTNYAPGSYNESFSDAIPFRGAAINKSLVGLKENVVKTEQDISKLTPHTPSDSSRYDIMMKMYKYYKDLANLAIKPDSTIAKYRADCIKDYNDFNKAMKQYNADYRE